MLPFLTSAYICISINTCIMYCNIFFAFTILERIYSMLAQANTSGKKDVVAKEGILPFYIFL